MQNCLNIFLILSFCVQISFTKSEFNNDLGKELFRYCQVVFCENVSILNWNCGDPCNATSGMIDQKVISSDKLCVQIFKINFSDGYQPNSDKIVVVFRGSYTTLNWILDFVISHHEHFCSDCKVHLGFLTAWLSIRHEVLDQIRSLKNAHPKAGLFITGHSLGGAIASLAAVEAQTIGLNVTALYTFGCPRVGNLAFSQYLNQIQSTTYRVVHHYDIVPQLLPQQFGYHHYGTEVWFNAEFTEFVLCEQGEGEDPNCENSVNKLHLKPDDHPLYYGLRSECQQESVL